MKVSNSNDSFFEEYPMTSSVVEPIKNSSLILPHILVRDDIIIHEKPLKYDLER